MAQMSEAMIPEIFLKIIRQRIADYISKEVKEMVAEETSNIISDVLSNLQCETKLFNDMLRYETKLVVNAVYNGVEIEQKEQSDGR